MRSISKLIIQLILCIIVLVMLVPKQYLVSASNYQLIHPPNKGGSLRNLTFYPNSGSLCLAYRNYGTNTYIQMFYLNQNGGQWLTPIGIPFPNSNEKKILAVKQLSNGKPMLLLSGDDTNYLKLLNLTTPLPSPDPNGNLVPGMTNSDLANIVYQNQRLFFSFNDKSGWSIPMPVPGTFRALDAILEPGINNDALIIFSKDGDKDPMTVRDIELYAALYTGIHWTEPVKLTSNSQTEYDLQAKWIIDRYVITWVQDEDNNPQTQNDKKIYYAEINSTGAVLQSARPVVSDFQHNAFPVLGSNNNQGVLLWTVPGDNSQYALWEADYDHGWSKPQSTGLMVPQMGQARLFTLNQVLYLVYSTNNLLYVAINEGNGWHSPGPVADLNQSGLDIDEMGYYADLKGILNVAIAAQVPLPGRGSTDENKTGDALYYTSFGLGPDLSINSCDISPSTRHIGSQCKLKFSVGNRGYLSSQPFEVAISKDGQILEKLSSPALVPGGSTSFTVDLTQDHAASPLELSVISSNDLNPNNNVYKLMMSVQPDYEVRSVTRTSPTVITARVVENKELAAASVPVDFYLAVGTEMTKIGSSLYDPRADLPVTVSWPGLSNITSPFQIIVEVNQERKVAEDNYLDNKGSFVYNPLPDFIIPDFWFTKERIHLLVENRGELAVPNVELLLTENPDTVTQGKDQAAGKLLYFKTISLNGAPEVTVDILRKDLPSFSGINLYAVVNPYGAIGEGNPNNNMAMALEMKDAPGSPRLVFEKIKAKHQKIVARVANQGDGSVTALRVELLNNKQQLLASHIIPVLRFKHKQKVRFENVSPGTYILRASYISSGGINQSISSTVILPAHKKPLPPFKYGDVNNDGKVNVDDVKIIQSYLKGKMKFNDIQLEAADVNEDGEVTDEDVNLLLKYIHCDIKKLPSDCDEDDDDCKAKHTPGPTTANSPVITPTPTKKGNERRK
jgi:hypothetical protein